MKRASAHNFYSFLLRLRYAFAVLSFRAFHLWFTAATAATYRVGPDQIYARIGDAPIDSLNPGDVVEIHYRTEPYHEKFIIRRSGTESAPIIIRGVPKQGELPIIDGTGALQAKMENQSEAGRWLIKVGDGTAGDHVRIENLRLRNANNLQKYEISGKHYIYEDNAAGVFVRSGRDVVIAGCLISGCGNGVQTSYAPNVDHVTVSHCFFHDNGNHKNPASDQEHNVYLCGTHTVVQFCRFGGTHPDGNNLKERGVDTVIRYNWIEGGKNRQLDLVDHEQYKNSDAYVYGNVIIQGRNVNNNNMINWGGDSDHSRSGTLYFFNNTVIGKAEKTRFLVVRYPDCAADIKNNVFTGSGVLWNGTGSLKGSNNWFSTAIGLPPFATTLGIKGISPGFAGTPNTPYLPGLGSVLLNTGTSTLPKRVEYMPLPWTGGVRRPNDGRIDIGAFEGLSVRRKQ